MEPLLPCTPARARGRALLTQILGGWDGLEKSQETEVSKDPGSHINQVVFIIKLGTRHPTWRETSLAHLTTTYKEF